MKKTIRNLTRYAIRRFFVGVKTMIKDEREAQQFEKRVQNAIEKGFRKHKSTTF